MKDLHEYGLEVFGGDAQKFEAWMKSKCIALGGISQLEMLTEANGYRHVMGCLEKIDKGNLA